MGPGPGKGTWAEPERGVGAADRCPYCLADLEAEFAGEPEPSVHCARCGTAHHLACFLEHGRCTLYGCGGTTPSATPPARLRPGSLSPFTPVGEPRMQRAAAFLSVVREDRQRTRGSRPRLELRAPARVTAGDALALEALVAAPGPLRGHGLRLAVESWLEGSPGRLLLHEEAVLVGRPRRDWLERLRLRRARPRTLVACGLHRFQLRLDTRRLLWRGASPGERVAPQRLSLRLSCEGRGAPRGVTREVRLLDGRAAVPKLVDGGLEEVEVPPLVGGGGSWGPRPVVGAAPDVPLAVAAAKPWRVGRSRLVPDTLDLEAELVLRGGGPYVTARLSADLHHGLRGELRLVVESRFALRGRMRSYGEERVLLARGGDDRGGRHRVQVAYPVPAVIAAGRGRRALLVYGELAGEGRPLRTRPVRLTLPQG